MLIAPETLAEWLAVAASTLIPWVTAYAARSKNTKPLIASVLAVALAVLTTVADGHGLDIEMIGQVAIQSILAQFAAFKMFWNAPVVDINARAAQRRRAVEGRSFSQAAA